MQKYLLILLLLACPLLIVMTKPMASLTGPERIGQQGRRKPRFEDERWPIVNPDAPEPSDPHARAKRQAKNRRYNNSKLVPKPPFYPGSGEANLINDWEVGFPAIPSDRSTLVVVGMINNAHAHLSEDRTGIYSEFEVSVERVLKNSGPAAVAPGNSLTVERVGGRLRVPSGHIQQFGISKQGMPKVGARYVLFLSGDEQQGLHILTGYELRDGLVFPLDGADPADGNKIPQFARYEGAGEASFMKAIEEALTRPPQGTSAN